MTKNITPRRKRQRYLERAKQIATENNVDIDLSDWDKVWSLLDMYGLKSGKTQYCVYAIVDLKNNFVKFGKSVNPNSRLKQLSTGSGCKLVLAAFCKETSELNESEIHKKLKHHRLRREWFTLNSVTQRYINKIRESAGIKSPSTQTTSGRSGIPPLT